MTQLQQLTNKVDIMCSELSGSFMNKWYNIIYKHIFAMD